MPPDGFMRFRQGVLRVHIPSGIESRSYTRFRLWRASKGLWVGAVWRQYYGNLVLLGAKTLGPSVPTWDP